MFGLELHDAIALAAFAASVLGGIVGLFIRVGRVLEKVTAFEARSHDHEKRIRRVESRLGLPPAPLETGKVVMR